MAWPVAAADHGERYVKESDKFPQIRVLTVLKNEQNEQQENILPTRWQVISKSVTPKISATCYHFARKYHLETGFPVGIVVAAVPETKIEKWMTKESRGNCVAHQPDHETLYNGMIHPLRKFIFMGIVMYQGESVRLDFDD